jgi:hypothetical protein
VLAPVTIVRAFHNISGFKYGHVNTPGPGGDRCHDDGGHRTCGDIYYGEFLCLSPKDFLDV